MHPLTSILRNPRQVSALAAGTAAVVGLAAYAIFHKRPTAAELEARRREHLAATGRITDGTLTDALPQLVEPNTVVYRYRIAGVTYECNQDVSAMAAGLRLPALDLPVQVRYDRANPADSIVLAESWNGLWSVSLPPQDLPRVPKQ